MRCIMACMNKKRNHLNQTKISRFLSLVLRHQPQALHIDLDPQGWTDAEFLLEQLETIKGWKVSWTDLEAIVRDDNKGRYTLKDGRIRANQGHSVPNVLAVSTDPVDPPAVLYHGTTEGSWTLIQESGGLKPMNRHHVHLSADIETAKVVGARRRHQVPVVLVVDAQLMHEHGNEFYLSDNGVWHVERVPLTYLSLMPADG